MHDAEQDVPQRHDADGDVGDVGCAVRSRDVDLLCGLVRDERTLLAAMRGLHEVDGPGLGRLSERVMDAWSAFGRRGDPNTDDLPDWRAYRADERNTMVFGPNIRTITEDREAERAAWSTSILS